MTAVTRAEGKRRLLVLAAKLERIPPRRFYFGRWVGAKWKGRQDLSCGTTACAMGWAATMPVFRKLGLRLRKVGSGKSAFGEVFMPGLADHFLVLPPIVAASEVFGLTFNEAEFLFIPTKSGLSERASAKQVAAHIRRFVSSWGDQ